MHVLNSNTRSHNYKNQNARKVGQRRASLNDFRAAINIIAAAQGLDPDMVLGQARSEARIALCRQIAMYIAHVSLGYSQTLVGQLFHRDRSTVAHACARIEDMRDDTSFDESLTHLEQILGFANILEDAAQKDIAQ